MPRGEGRRSRRADTCDRIAFEHREKGSVREREQCDIEAEVVTKRRVKFGSRDLWATEHSAHCAEFCVLKFDTCACLNGGCAALKVKIGRADGLGCIVKIQMRRDLFVREDPHAMGSRVMCSTEPLIQQPASARLGSRSSTRMRDGLPIA